MQILPKVLPTEFVLENKDHKGILVYWPSVGITIPIYLTLKSNTWKPFDNDNYRKEDHTPAKVPGPLDPKDFFTWQSNDRYFWQLLDIDKSIPHLLEAKKHYYKTVKCYSGKVEFPDVEIIINRDLKKGIEESGELTVLQNSSDETLIFNYGQQNKTYTLLLGFTVNTVSKYLDLEEEMADAWEALNSADAKRHLTRLRQLHSARL